MDADALVFRFAYRLPGSGKDIRTFNAYQAGANGAETHIYEFVNYEISAMNSETTFRRWNRATNVWDTAGVINWPHAHSATVVFGASDGVSLQSLRRAKKKTSKSRRFRAEGSEFKWKVAENGSDLFCVNAKGKTVAAWEHDDLTLRVAANAHPLLEQLVLDRIVVTCMLNLWMLQHNGW